ncbi:MAG: sugar ABC transporter ATP-binding protein [Bacillota bacterium]
MSDNIIEIKNITKEFPGVKALDNVSFNIKKGEIHAVVGENGAGKSTLMKILSGVYKPTKGEYIVKGNRVSFKNTKEAQENGISIIYQEFSLVPYLNTIDNIFLGREITNNKFLNRKIMRKEAKETLEKINVSLDLNKPINDLTVAEQQFVEIAKALSIDADILILDEPTASLTEGEIDHLFSLIRTLKENGVTMIYISHHMDEIFEISDRITCLRDGKCIDTVKTNETNEPEIVKMMVGKELENSFNKLENKTMNISDEIILNVKKLKRPGVKDNLKFNLHKGEILGIAGLVGAGRTETIRALLGIDEYEEKEVYLEKEKVNLKNASDSLNKGLGLIPENRKTQGLVADLTLKENISLTNIMELKNKYGFIDQKKEKKQTQNLVNDLSIKTPSINQLVKNLSGGNQQKVVLAKWLATNTKVLIFDEPTRGIDVKTKSEIYKLIQDLSNKGKGIIVISSELPEVITLSDRVLVMHKGKIKALLEGENINSEKIMYYATGGEN